MQRVANVYMTSRSGFPSAIKSLLESNRIDYVEIDISDDLSMCDWIREKARSIELPVVEFDGRFAAGPSIPNLARALGLKLPPRDPVAPGACC